MWPWGHLALGYLVYSLAVHLRDRRAPDGVAAVALAFGTQFPDLVDKPLAWTLEVLPHGHSLAHSLITTVVVIAVVTVVLPRRGYGRVAAAFAVGYVSHLFGDALSPVLEGELSALRFLAWPVVPAVESATEGSFVAQLRELSLDAFLAFELAMGLAVFALWLRDGAPGLDVAASIPRWVGRKLSA